MCPGGHKSQLPPNWTILYVLSQLPEDMLKVALTDGRINSGISRKDALALKPSKKPTPESTAGAAKTSSSPNPPELSTIWEKTPADQRQVFLDRIGCENLCAAMSNTLRADFHDRAVSLAGASASSDFAIYSTDKLHAAFHAAEQSEPDMERMVALLNCIIKRANTKGIARSDLVIAQGKLKGRK